MNQGAKQRIVGTVVLLALALIFLPIIFDGQGSYQAPMTSRIPETPIISILPEPVQTRPDIVGGTVATNPDSVTTVDLTTVDLTAETAPDIDPNEETAVDLVAEEQAPQVEISESQATYTRTVPALSDTGLPQGWSVRLGSFSDSDNATALMARLQNAGYKAYTRAMQSDQGTLTGVFVGPWLDRGQVNEYQQKLQQEFSLAGLVVRYELEQL